MKRILTYTATFIAGSLLSGTIAFATTNMVQAEKGTSTVQLNGSSITNPPKLVYGGTTYVQLYSIQNGLQTVLGTRPTWDGNNFNIITQDTNSPEGVAKELLALSQHQQWDVLYGYLHPDVQAKYTQAQFIADRAGTDGMWMTVKTVDVQTASMISSWTDSTGTGKTYANVAEVPFTITFNDGTAINANMHLVKASDGTWRYFWAPSS